MGAQMGVCVAVCHYIGESVGGHSALSVLKAGNVPAEAERTRSLYMSHTGQHCDMPPNLPSFK